MYPFEALSVYHCDQICKLIRIDYIEMKQKYLIRLKLGFPYYCHEAA